MQRTKWVDRKFELNLPEGWLPNVLERLRGTSVRINEIVTALSENQLSHKPTGKWSIKEHIGHLGDLEQLHEGRIDDFIAKNETLKAADMGNTKTHDAEHDQKSIQQLLRDFKVRRYEFISRLEKLDDASLQFASLHPRVKKMMKPVDLAFFIAEHDDHHLADIREIIKLL